MSKVAVLLSSYNGENYIKEQIDSILNQCGDFDVDLIVRDDGSSDGTLRILENYKNKDLLKWYKGENLGPAKSFLELLHKTKDYDYYAFSDQDDVWPKYRLKYAIDILKKHDAPTIVMGNKIIVKDDLEQVTNTKSTRHYFDLHSVACFGGVQGCASVFNSSLAHIIQTHELPYKVIMHDSFIAMVCVSVGGEIIFDARPYVLYRQHEDNTLGYSLSKINTFKRRLKTMFEVANVSIATQANEVASIYDDLISDEMLNILGNIGSYRDTLRNRIKLSCSKKIHYETFSLSVADRISILLGNR